MASTLQEVMSVWGVIGGLIIENFQIQSLREVLQSGSHPMMDDLQ